MKHFHDDWEALYEALPLWEELDLPARAALLTFFEQPSYTFRRDGMEPADREALERGGFIVPMTDGIRVKLAMDRRPFHRLIKGMGQFPLLAVPTGEAPIDYLRTHFNLRERAALYSGSGSSYGFTDTALYGKLASIQWIERFLSAGDGLWAEPYLTPEEENLLEDPDIREAAQCLVRALREGTSSIPFMDAPRLLGDRNPALLCPALEAGIRLGLLWPALNGDELEPMIGLLPALKARIDRPEAEKPHPVKAGRTFRRAYLMEDLTTVLAVCIPEPLRLRRDYSLYAKEYRKLESTLSGLPDWVEKRFHTPPATRINQALCFLMELGWASFKGKPGKDLYLRASQAGREALALPGKKRIEHLLHWLMERTDHVRGYFDDHQPTIEFLPLSAERSWWMDDDDIDYVQKVRETMLAVKRGTFVSLDAFLRFHREKNNPLLQTNRPDREVFFDYGFDRRSEEYDRSYWNDVLLNFLSLRLLPLGGMEAGTTAGGEVCFTLTGTGDYLLGAARDFEFDEEEKREIVVQPDFEIVFLAPAPMAEAELIRIAERRGKGGIGRLFRITRSSILKAGAAGMTAEQVLAILKANTTNSIPSNVAHEVRNWVGQFRKAEIRRAFVIECPDPTTADRIRSAAGGSVVALSPTLLELRDPKKKGTLVKKLKEEGVFL